MPRPRICIVSHAAYGALAGYTHGHIGGVEHQTSLLAKWLVARGYSVDMVVWREAGDTAELIEGVRVLPVCRRDEGLPGLRFIYPRWSSLLTALRRSNAAVYYHNTAEYVTGQVALWCRSAGRRFVFSAAHDADCDAALPLLRARRERVLYRLGLRCSDTVVVQTVTQQRMMQAGFGRAAVIIPMPCPEPAADMIIPSQLGPRSSRVLWVGRLCVEKRPELFLDVAERAPHMQFDLVGPADGSSYGSDIVERARRIPNVTYHGPVLRAGLPAMYARAACLLCTSSAEGFPNTFLEAWSLGLPVVSTFDPDNLIHSRQLGIACASSPDAILGALTRLVSSQTSWAPMSEHSRAYYASTHRPELALSAMEDVLVNGHPRHVGMVSGCPAPSAPVTGV